ncbi:MAG: mechanosensitive ion channel domain-containing protein [Cyanobacteria bacterium P01_G01_bin.54]
MIKLIFIRTRKTLIFAVSVLALTTATALPAIPQEAEAEATEETESVLVESTIVGDVDPSQAISVSDLTIPVDQLDLLVKPLTLEELQTESAAWFLLLRDKVQEISSTEIAIKRENAVIQQEQEAAKAVEEAKEKLSSAEAALEEAEPETPAYERATKELEDAKEALLTAEKAVEDVKAATEALEEDETLQDAVAEAESEEEITQANEVLKEAEKERDKLEAGSEEYQAATEKIDALNVAIVDLETAEEELATTVPGSPENVEAEAALAQARETVTQASDALITAGLAPTVAEEQPEIESEEADAALDEVAEDVGDSAQGATGEDGDTAPSADGEDGDTAPSADGEAETPDAETAEEPDAPQDEAEAAGEAAEELEGIDETLEEVADAEADLKNQLVANAAELQLEQSALIERFNVVLDALEEKGGDVTSYRKYIDAVSGIELDIQDTEGLAVRLTAWLKSEEGGIRWGLNIAKFVGIVVAAAIAAQILSRTVDKLLKKLPGFSDLFRQFLVVFTKRGIIVIGVLGALTSLGVSLGPVLALVGGVSFVLAFALQSNLGNFASGLMLLINKPFDVGDEVKAGGYWAYVDSISLASTKLRSFGGDIITVPNNTVWGGDIINHTHSDRRQIAIPLRIRFSQDFYTVFEMWKKLTLTNPLVIQDPAPSFFPYNSNYEYYIGLTLKAWVKTTDHWAVYIDLLGKLQKQIEAEGIEMSIPGTEVILPESIPPHIAEQLSSQEGSGVS